MLVHFPEAMVAINPIDVVGVYIEERITSNTETKIITKDYRIMIKFRGEETGSHLIGFPPGTFKPEVELKFLKVIAKLNAQ